MKFGVVPAKSSHLGVIASKSSKVGIPHSEVASGGKPQVKQVKKKEYAQQPMTKLTASFEKMAK